MEIAKKKERSYSMGLIEDMWKRKREKGEALNGSGGGKEDGVFQKSKKTQRSPVGRGAEEGKLERLLKEMRKENRVGRDWKKV